MQPRNRTFFRLLDAAQHRFRRARPGSVLIMVVSLLVLLALIGTAAMSTSRLDRTSSLQNVKNVQVDLLAEGVKRMVLGILSKDAGAANVTDSTVLDPDVPVNDEVNALLASLLAERQLKRNAATGAAVYPTTPPGAGEYVLQNVSYPPVRTGVEQVSATGVYTGPYRFDVPTEPDAADPQYNALPNPKPAMVPDVVTIGGVVYPSLRAIRPDGNWMATFPNRDGTPSATPARVGDSPFLAADTDADGVADAMLVKLPIGPLGGVTYYAAVRVVDNAAKINLNTAANADLEVAQVNVRNGTATTTANLSFAGIYPASVMLEDLLDGTTPDGRAAEGGNVTEIDKVRGQRVFGDRTWGTGAYAGLVPYDSSGTARPDFVFLTAGDSAHNQLGRRLDNPTWSGPNSKQGSQLWMYGEGIRPAGAAPSGKRPFGVADAMALAYRYTLINPASQDSIVEKTLFMTTLKAFDRTGQPRQQPNKAYAQTPGAAGAPAPGVVKWFDDNFDYRWKAQTETLPADQTGWAAQTSQFARTMLTSFNPVSTAVPKRNVPRDRYRFWYVSDYAPVPAGFGQNNDPIPASPDTYRAPKVPANTVAERQPFAALTMRSPFSGVYPGKANLNTATFEELWQRYFDVMCQDATSSPFDAGADDPIYQGSSFTHPPATASNAPQDFTSNPLEHAARMFRSPLRPEVPVGASGAMTRMHPYQVMALRAAIAAANTIAMRTDFNPPPPAQLINDRDIPFFEIILPQVDEKYAPGTYPAQYTNPPNVRPNFYASVGATVYGVKRQPFMTEVFLDNNVEQVPAAVPNPPLNVDGNPATNQSGFAAIELYNPYDRPMRISGWKLGLVDRRRVNDTGARVVDWQNEDDRNPPKLQVVDLPDNGTPSTWTPENPNAAAYTPFIFDADAVIPPHGFLVVSNLPLPNTPAGQIPTSDTEIAQYSPADTRVNTLVENPADGGVKLVYAKKLHWMMNREIQLFRPVERLIPGHGTTPWVVRWAPVDSFDATGMVHRQQVSGTPFPTADSWHYVRSNDRAPTAMRNWHFVYPGRYEAIAGATDGRHQGIERTQWATPDQVQHPWGIPVPNPLPPPAPPPVIPPPTVTAPTPTKLGNVDRYNSRDALKDYSNTPVPAVPPTSTFPIQIANADLASQFMRVADAGGPGGPTFPLNGFARLGDIMQVTYIGSYTIWDADANWGADVVPPIVPSNAEKWSSAGAEQDPAPFPTGPLSPTPKPPPILPFLAGGGGRFIEINPVSMDASFAEDTDITNDRKPSTNVALEDVGRFAPMNFDANFAADNTLPLVDLNAWKYDLGQVSLTGGAGIKNTFQPDGTWLQNHYPTDFWDNYDCIIYNPNPTPNDPWTAQVRRIQTWDKASNTITLASDLQYPIPNGTLGIYRFRLQRVRYGWATKLLDYFTTTNAPADDYLPNVDPQTYVAPLPPPEPVKNTSDSSRTVNRTGLRAEDDIPTEGLININTANWKVLAQLPLVMTPANPPNPPTVNRLLTEELARKIVYFRDVDDLRGVDPNNINPAVRPPHPHGPFKSLHELCLIPEFVTAMGTIDPTTNPTLNPGIYQGDFSPMTMAGDEVRQDFKEKYLNLNRIANLVTLKSDSFTVYLQVQGWRDAGSPNAKMVAQKRLSFIVDRSQADTRSPSVYNVPVAE